MAEVEALKMKKDQTINVDRCPSCGGRHEAVAVWEYKTPQPPWTHWFQCPTTSDPAQLTLMTADKGEHFIELSTEMMKRLVAAQHIGRYMVAIWDYDPAREKGAEIELWRVTEQYPTSEFDRSLETLHVALDAETQPPAAAEMPEAAPRMPMVNLFGAPSNE